MTALHPTFDHIVSSWQRRAAAAGTPPTPSLKDLRHELLEAMPPKPKFTEGLRLALEVEDTPQNRELLTAIEALIIADPNASAIYEESETAYCSTCHEAMPYFHTHAHNCLKEAN